MRWPTVAAAVLLMTGCAADTNAAGSTVTVFAASSLKAPFSEMQTMYLQQNPGADLTINFAGSADLVAQLQDGAPADVLATADQATMTASGLAGAQVFATNTLTVIVPPDNPGGVSDVTDLSDPALTVVICAPQVPCGAATAQMASNADVDIAADSEESAVADVLGKVASGQADAGVVYVTDLTSTPGVRGIPIPQAVNVTTTYLIASADPAGQGFIDLVLSDTGQAVLRDDGFGPQ